MIVITGRGTMSFKNFKLPKKIKTSRVGNSDISTIYVYAMSGMPSFYETMVFGGKLDMEQERCNTKKRAIIEHALMVDRVTHHPHDGNATY